MKNTLVMKDILKENYFLVSKCLQLIVIYQYIYLVEKPLHFNTLPADLS